MKTHIAVDIGGTQIRAACYAEDSLAPLQVKRISTQAPQSTPLEQVQAAIQSVWPQDRTVAGLGVAAPGPLDPYQGIIFNTPNISNWENLPLQAILEDRFHTPTALGNDANLAALGEWKFGAGSGQHHLLYITVSTGIGGGAIVDDRLLLGVQGLGGEFGHVPILANGPPCTCGQNGHLEALASGPAIARYVEDQIAQGAASSLKTVPHPLNAKHVAQAAFDGDPLAVEAFQRAARFLGIGISGFLHLFNPAMVILGGGVAQSSALLLDPLHKELAARVMSPQFFEHLTLVPSMLKDDAGLMGALALARQNSQ